MYWDLGKFEALIWNRALWAMKLWNERIQDSTVRTYLELLKGLDLYLKTNPGNEWPSIVDYYALKWVEEKPTTNTENFRKS